MTACGVGSSRATTPSATRPIETALPTTARDTVLWRAFARLVERRQALLRLFVSSDEPSYEEIAAALEVDPLIGDPPSPPIETSWLTISSLLRRQSTRARSHELREVRCGRSTGSP